MVRCMAKRISRGHGPRRRGHHFGCFRKEAHFLGERRAGSGGMDWWCKKWLQYGDAAKEGGESSSNDGSNGDDFLCNE